MDKDKAKKINEVSPSFCIAKWKQVTIDLHNGQTHSCHHPLRHDIPLEELKNNPSALHNTNFKKLKRKEMLEGTRPEECVYCWNIEDSGQMDRSDRILKSVSSWAYPHLEEIKNSPWDDNVVPSYVEVMFDNKCNFACSYCMSNVSSSIEAEMDRFGLYPLELAKYHRATSIPKKYEGEENPYVEAFWKWFPTIKNELQTFRITGGEPMLSPHTMKLIEFLIDNPSPEMHFALNTNLSVQDDLFDKYVLKIKKLMDNKSIKWIEFFTSFDSFGDQAQYIRFGLNFKKMIRNIERLGQAVPNCSIIVMVTFNILSIPRLYELVKAVVEIREKHNFDLKFDLSYLKDPAYLSANNADDKIVSIYQEQMTKIQEEFISKDLLQDHEKTKLERTFNWVKTTYQDPKNEYARGQLIKFLDEYDKRKRLNFLETFPEFEDFYNKYKSQA